MSRGDEAMAFEFQANESIRKGIKRLVCRQLDSALSELSGSHPDSDDTIHNARKRFKKLRSVLRLVRDRLGNKIYRRENYRFRDAARPLTEMRDATVLIETLDNLLSHYAGEAEVELY